ncbi:hypothetical protein E2562_016189 [Oryza meyeriana var. granulata]|uniref:Uncharacterized protein n=1 Tax=Oryza meyeriana var. granulata TaxID=110450 RepID=A0A6G1CPD5_9ORYZ|nr:hypothetical protein E2562_016189 [Oryza meyeriana var. granulata]
MEAMAAAWGMVALAGSAAMAAPAGQPARTGAAGTTGLPGPARGGVRAGAVSGRRELQCCVCV